MNILENKKINNITYVYVIHWYITNRNSLQLTDIEFFHINCLKHYINILDIFENIIISIVVDEYNYDLINFLKKLVLNELSIINNKIIFKIEKNDSTKGEFITFNNTIFPLFSENRYILYTHFKGVTAKWFNRSKDNLQLNEDEILLNEKYWSWLMYYFNLNYINEMNNSFKKNMFFGGMLSNKKFNKIQIINYSKYIKTKYIQQMINNSFFCNYPGTYYWLNTYEIKKYIETYISFNNFVKDLNLILNRITHISEYLPALFYNLDEPKCSKKNKKKLTGTKYHLYSLNKDIDNQIEIFTNFLKTNTI